jgi:ADP-dependent phosphofructokinase/glucokinase
MTFKESERDSLERGDLCNANKSLAGRIETNLLIEEIELKPPEKTSDDTRTERFQRSVGVLEPKGEKVRCGASYDCSLQ